MLSYIFEICLCRFTNNILTTAQQVWLQKFGGAKNPVSQLSDNFIKEGEPQIQKSVSELKLTQKDTRQEEKLTPEGLRPGERLIVLLPISLCFCRTLLFQS